MQPGDPVPPATRNFILGTAAFRRYDGVAFGPKRRVVKRKRKRKRRAKK